MAVGGLVASVVAGMVAALAAGLVPGVPEVAAVVGVDVVMALLAVSLVGGARRFVDRRPGGEPGLGFTARVVPQVLVGLAAGFLVIVVADGLCVVLGAARWEVRLTADRVVVVVAGALLAQAVPEELWFRGYLFRNLSAVWRPGTALVVSSLVFGVLHIVSHSEAVTLTERVLYVAQAAVMGGLLVVCRIAGGDLWLPIGVHAGHNIAAGSFIAPGAGLYAVMLGCEMVVMAAVAWIVLRSRPSGQRLPVNRLPATPPGSAPQ
ncbi:hypothetical protein GCM10022226_80820 [Sphaerisporangium flaviroseum]|uniref:CAAX prenyl protease 2/Lysostaphin resistance protein A-like domain-containing protein n=2 Tax=Sphaerisporangium flaviroseum TaxID=509199 RepID=A0ABP7JHT6_9ACTN